MTLPRRRQEVQSFETRNAIRRANRLEADLERTRAGLVDQLRVNQELRVELGMQGRELAKVEAERDAAYRGRAELIALIAKAHNESCPYRASVLVHGADPDAPGWPVLFIDANPGQLSWHINPADLDLFEGIPQLNADDPKAPVWDGHDDAEKSRRLTDIDFRYI